ncbi:unnamed protein product [Bemisia tabaci]|uniref:Uncharacterized protein n=1 Tax=Bemisia tabaci TaxID=7038 RepID=A0A9P0FA21_BEMTA|nr:unnamed protein product [Bemisia tabaci]
MKQNLIRFSPISFKSESWRYSYGQWTSSSMEFCSELRPQSYCLECIVVDSLFYHGDQQLLHRNGVCPSKK